MTTKPLVLRPMLKYFGSKWRLSLKLPPPAHEQLVEPFAGGAGYSHRYGAGRRVLLYDVDPRVVAVWRYLVGASEREILRLPDVGLDDSLDDFKLCEEARLFIGYWLGVLSADKVVGRMQRRYLGKGGMQWSATVRTRTAAQLQHIRRWRAVEGSYETARVRGGGGSATWMVDPPYERLGKYYDERHIDYAELGKWCKQLRGQVMVTEQLGAKWLPFRHLATYRSAWGHSTTEVVWYGGRR